MRTLLVVAALSLVSFLAGCSSMMDTKAQRSRRIDQITDLQKRQLVDDWDYFWLYDRNSGLTQWHSRIGI